MKRTTTITTAAAIAVTLLAAAALTVNVRQQLPAGNDDVTCTVTAKSATDGSEQIEHLRIDSAECGSFRIADPILVDASTRGDLYRSIETGQTYTFDSRGDRIELLSLVPNIVATTPAE